MTLRVLDVCAAVVFSDDGRLLLAAGRLAVPGWQVDSPAARCVQASLEGCIRREAAEELACM